MGSAFLKPCFIYPKMLTADIILQYVRDIQNSMGSNIETLYKIVADKAEALEFRVRGDSRKRHPQTGHRDLLQLCRQD